MNVSNACVCQKSARGKDKVLSCDVCFIKYHISCLQLSNDLVKVLTDTSVKVPWTCNRCKSNIKELTAENNRLNCRRDYFKSCQTTYKLNSPSVSKFVAVFAWRILKYFYIKRNVFYIYLVTNTLSERMINIETVYSNKSEIFAHMNL